MPEGNSRSTAIAIPKACHPPGLSVTVLLLTLSVLTPGFAAGPPSAAPDSTIPSPSVSVPISQPDSPLTLTGSVLYALQHSPQIELADAQRKRAAALLIPQQVGFHPAINVNAYQSFQGPTLSLPLQSGRRVVIPSQEHQASISADQILYHAGATANSARLGAMTASADAVYQDAVGTEAHDVMTAFYTVLQARAGETLARAAVPVVARNVENVRLLIVARQAVRADLLNVQATLAEAETLSFYATN